MQETKQIDLTLTKKCLIRENVKKKKNKLYREKESCCKSQSTSGILKLYIFRFSSNFPEIIYLISCYIELRYIKPRNYIDYSKIIMSQELP